MTSLLSEVLMFYRYEQQSVHQFDVWEVSWSEPLRYIKLLGTLTGHSANAVLISSHQLYFPQVGRLMILEHHDLTLCESLT